MLKNLLKKRLSVAEAKDKVEQCKLLESYHWERSSYHRGMLDSIMKERTEAESSLREAEQAFIKAHMKGKDPC